MAQEIPINAVEYQEFQTTFKENTYDLTINYNKSYDTFVLSIYLDEQPILTGKLLVIGRNVLASFQSLGLGKSLGLVNTGEVENPTFEDLGNNVKLIYVEE